MLLPGHARPGSPGRTGAEQKPSHVVRSHVERRSGRGRGGGLASQRGTRAPPILVSPGVEQRLDSLKIRAPPDVTRVCAWNVVHSTGRVWKILHEPMATHKIHGVITGKLLFLLLYDRLVKKSPRRKKRPFHRGSASMSEAPSTELSTVCVDKGFYLYRSVTCQTFLSVFSAMFRKFIHRSPGGRSG